MPWSAEKQNWSSNGPRIRYRTQKGHIILCPLGPRHRVREDASVPSNAEVWFVENLYVFPRHRRKGQGVHFFRMAVKKLLSLVDGPFYLGLLRDNVVSPRRTALPARKCWEAFLERDGRESTDGFARFGGDA